MAMIVVAAFRPSAAAVGADFNGHLGLLMVALIVVAIMLVFPQQAFTLMGFGDVFTWFAYYSVNPALAVQQTLDLMVQRALLGHEQRRLDLGSPVRLHGVPGGTGQSDPGPVQGPAPGHLADPRIARRGHGHHLRDLRHRLRHHRRGGDADGAPRLSGDAQGRIQHAARRGRHLRRGHPRDPRSRRRSF